jgi:tetratricopeptide (TPR) repeat protein
VAIREAMIIAPRSAELTFQFAWGARHLGRLRESIAAIEKLDRARYQHQRWYWENLLIPYHELGDHQRELELATEWSRVRPDDRYALICEARALVGLGRLAEVNARVDEATRVPLEAPGGRSPVDVFFDVGRDLRAHGHRQEARALFEQGIRWIEARPAAEQRDRRDYLAALLDGAGRYDEVWPIVKQLAAEKPDDVDLQAWLGTVAARRGDRKEVARIDRWLARRQGPYLNGYHTFQRARLAAVVGDRERAFQLYHQAVEEGASRHFDDVHADPDFESLRDYPPFQELTRPKD